MAQLVYVLNTYEEHGAEEVKATLDPAKIKTLIKKYEHEWNARNKNPISFDDEIEKFLSIKELKPGSYQLSNGWGGLELHVVELS